MIDRLTGGLAGLLDAWMPANVIGWLTDGRTDWLTAWLTDWLADWITDCVIGRPIFLSINQSNNWSIIWLTKWLCQVWHPLKLFSTTTHAVDLVLTTILWSRHNSTARPTMIYPIYINIPPVLRDHICFPNKFNSIETSMYWDCIRTQPAAQLHSCSAMDL